MLISYIGTTDKIYSSPILQHSYFVLLEALVLHWLRGCGVLRAVW